MADALSGDNITDLGEPEIDGIRGVIRTEHLEESLTWNLSEQVWVGAPRITMRTNELIGIATNGNPSNWKYPGPFSEAPSLVAHPTAFGFFIHKVRYAGELWAAGLRLQEHLCGEMRQHEDSGAADSEWALAWYPLGEGSDFLSPDSFNHGVRMRLDKDLDQTKYWFCSSGWQNQPELDVSPSIDEHFYPEIYQIGPATNLRRFTAQNRWVGGVDLGSSGSVEQSQNYIPWYDVRGWWRASSVLVPDGSAVSEIQDDSGKGVPLRQPTSNKRAIITKSDLGPSNEFRFFRHDGSNDRFGTLISQVPLSGPEYGSLTGPSVEPPFTVFFVMRQRASGGTQQVWLGNNSGAWLLFRYDASNQVSSWGGGSDLIYSRESNWPSPWIILSIQLNDDGTQTIWENDSLVATGVHTGYGLSGLFVGSSSNEGLPSAIDWASLALCQGEMDDAQRLAIVNYFNNIYEIF